MSTDIDERVVKLSFDNKKFEKNIDQSMKSIDELNKKLEFKDVSDGVNKVEASFSHLQIFMFNLVSRISNKIIDFGVNIVKALSIDNVTTGWIKFGQKTTSVATLAAQKIKMAGKTIDNYAEKMEAVNEQLEKLNWFTDETSYNFTDMVDNIGKFTAAGRGLDESVKAMEGISTWASLSGQSVNEASRAMYNLSQALGRGYVQLIDWKSIQNANMDTQEFRETVLETAIALGELTKEGDKYVTKTGKKFDIGQFAENLNEKWFTNDVLLKALGKYSSAVDEIYAIAKKEGLTATQVMEKYGDQLDKFGLKAFKAAQEARTLTDAMNSVKDAVSTGWMNTSELIFGDYDSAKKLWTELANSLYDLFAEGGNFRNEVLGFWKDLGGQDTLFGDHGSSNQGAFWNLYDSIIAIRDLVSESWNNVFSLNSFSNTTDKAKDLGEQLIALTNRWREFTKRVKDSLENSAQLQFILEGLFNVLKLGLYTLKAIRYAIDPIISLSKELVTNIFNRVAAFGSSLSKLEKIISKIETAAIDINTVFLNLFETIDINNLLNIILDGFSEFLSIIKDINPLKIFTSLFKSFVNGFKQSGGIFENIKKIFEGLVTIFKATIKVLNSLAGVLGKYLVPALEVFVAIVSSLYGVLTGILVNILGFIGSFVDNIASTLQNGKGFEEFKNNFIKGFEDFIDAMKPIAKSVIKIFNKIIKTITKIPNIINELSIKFTGNSVLDNISYFFDSLVNVFNKITSFLIKEDKVSNTIIKSSKKFRKAMGTLPFDNPEGNNSIIKEENFQFLDTLKDMLKSMTSILNSIVGILNSLLKLVAAAFRGLALLFDYINVGLRNITNALSKVKEKTDETEGKTSETITKGEILVIVITATVAIAAIAGAVAVLIYALNSLVAIFKPLTSALDNMTSGFYNITKSIQTKAIAEVIKSFTSFFLAMSALMLVIANTDDDTLYKTLGAMAGFIVLIGALIATLIILTKSMRTVGNTLVNLSTKGFNTISTFQYEPLRAIARVFESIGSLFVKISLAILLLRKLEVSQILASAGILSAFILVILGLMASLIFFSKKLSNNEKALKNISVLSSSTVKLVKQIARSLILMSLSIKILSSIDIANMWNAVGAITVLVVAFGLLSIALGKFANLEQKMVTTMSTAISTNRDASAKAYKFDKTGNVLDKALKSFALVLISIGISLKMISGISYGKIWNSVGVITTLLLAFTAMTLALDHFQNNSVLDSIKITGILKSISASVLSIAGSLFVLTIVNNTGNIWNSVGVIITILTAFTAMILILDNFQRKDTVNGERIALMINSIKKCLLAIAGSLFIISLIGGSDNVWTSVKATISIISALTAMLLLLNGFQINSDLDARSIANILNSMKGCLIAIAGSIAIISIVDDSNKVWTSVKAILAIITALGALFLVLSNFTAVNKANDLSKFSAGEITKSFSAIIKALSLITLNILVLTWVNDIGKLWSAIGAITAVLTALGVFIITVTHFSGNFGELQNAAKMFGSLAAVILALTISVKVLATLNDTGSMITSVLGVVTLILALSAAITLILKVQSKASDAIAGTILLSAFALEIFTLGQAISKLEDIPWETILTACAGFSLIILALASAVTLLSKNSVSPLSLISFSTALLIASASMIVFAEAMQKMADIKTGSIFKGLLTVTGGIALFAAAAIVLQGAIPVILLFASSLLLVSISLLATATGLRLITSAIVPFCQTVVENISLISEMLSSLGTIIVDSLITAFSSLLTKLTELLPTIADFITTFILEIIEIINNTSEALIDAVGNLFINLFNKVNEILPSLFNLINTALQGLLNLIVSNGDAIANAILTIITNLLTALDQSLPVILDRLWNILSQIAKFILSKVSTIVEYLATILIDVVNELGKHVPDLVNALCNFLIIIVKALFGNIGPVLEITVKLMVNFILDLLKLILQQAMKMVDAIAKGLITVLAYVFKTAITLLGSLGKLILDFLAGLILLVVNIFIGMTDVLFEALRTIVYNIFYILNKVILFVVSDLPNLFGGSLKVLLGGIVKLIGNIVNDYLAGLFGLGNFLLDVGKDMIDSGMASIDSTVRNGDNVIKAVDEARKNINKSMDSVTGFISEDATKAVNDLTGAASEAFEQLGTSGQKEAENAGTNVATGYVNGINGGSESAYNAGFNLGQQTMAGIAEGTDSHSPSRLAKVIGSYVVDGFAIGIDQNEYKATDSATQMAQAAIEASKAIVEEDVSGDIVIRPVLDMTNVRNGANDISSIMSNINGTAKFGATNSLTSNIQSNLKRKLSKSDEIQNGVSTINNAGDTYSAVFNITSNDPQAIAEEVNIRLQRMHIQSNLAKGGTR